MIRRVIFQRLPETSRSLKIISVSTWRYQGDCLPLRRVVRSGVSTRSWPPRQPRCHWWMKYQIRLKKFQLKGKMPLVTAGPRRVLRGTFSHIVQCLLYAILISCIYCWYSPSLFDDAFKEFTIKIYFRNSRRQTWFKKNRNPDNK